MTLPGGDLPKPADAATPAQADDEAAKTETGERTDDAAVTAVPAFDILRVEKDGSTVIAGRAEPGAKIEIVDGDKVIASADADISGDFAAVLDDPLTAGDHSLTLKATSRDGKATVSEEVATVSVPKDTAGELLAMVTKPGEASKIITMPDSQPVEIAASKDVTSDASDKAVTPADAATTAAAKAEPENASEAAVATPDLPASATDIASSPPLVSQDGTADRTEKQVPADDSAAVSTEAKAENPGRKQPASIPEVLVSAVELEGDKIFVAGNTRPRATVRVYADDAIVAEARADESGRFVAEGIARLAIGNHTIRADVLSVDGARVEFRASVPFFRPEGDLAAVASADAANDAPSIEPLANGAFDKARDEARKALELLKRLYADGKTPTAEELAAARSSAEIALKSLADVHVPADVDPALGAMARKASQDAAAALQKLRPLPADVKAFQAALGEVETIMSAVVKPVSELASADNARKTFTRPVTADSADDEEKAGEADAADVRVTPKADRLARSTNAEKAQLPGSEASPEETDARAVDGTPDAKPDTRTEGRSSTDDGPKVIEQAPLTQSEGSVIIRRGDTLWQISRRVYGKGVRYTTIYMANKTQIDDPDRIMPGQIFSMPGQWLDNAEELHKERLEHEHKGR
ncbi:MAG: LysM peptidoglycan-binding domain-containing protein [Rhizobiaceae bacterium]|nr:LysM peptidoglycan-binding domain-containing protein [Rhizobiaceae bacterium]